MASAQAAAHPQRLTDHTARVGHVDKTPSPAMLMSGGGRRSAQPAFQIVGGNIIGLSGPGAVIVKRHTRRCPRCSGEQQLMYDIRTVREARDASYSSPYP